MKKILSLLLVLCMAATLLPFAAFAADAYISVRVENGGAYVWYGAEDKKMVAGDATRYLTTTAEGVVAVGSEDNWNLKLEYPAGGTPVLTLKGATLKGGSGRFPLSVMGNADCTVVVETDSTVSTANRTCLYVSNAAETTITGPGKLTLSSTDGICISAGGGTTGTLVLKNADLQINVHGESTNRSAISVIGAGLTIDNSKVNIVSTGKTLGIWGHAAVTKDADGNITKLENTWKTDENDIARNIVIQNGSVVTGNATARQFLGASGDVVIKDSTVEAEVSHSRGVYEKKPVIEGEYTAVAGSKKDKVIEYNPSKFASYKYIKIVPGEVDLGTLGVVTEPTTEPTTAPSTEPTTEPTVEVTVPATTEPTVPATNEATTPATNEATKPEATAPEATEPDTQDGEEGGLSNAMLALIACIVVIVIGGAGAFVLLRFVIKPKWFMALFK